MVSEDRLQRILGGRASLGGAAVGPETMEVAQSVRRGLLRSGRDPNEPGDGPLGAGLTVLGRAFDVLSRPLYGVTNVVEGFQEEGTLAGGLARVPREIIEGITGRDKVFGADIAENAGLEGFSRGAVGFGLDVGLDPLTYVGGGIVKKAAKEAVEAAGARAASEFMQEALQSGTEARIARYAAERQARREFRLQGFSTAEANAGAKTVGDRFVQDTALERAMTASKALQEAEPGRVQLKLLGNEVASSERLYRYGRAGADVVSGTRVGKAFNKAFRPTATFVAGTNDTKRVVEAIGQANMERYANIVAEGGLLDNLTLPEAKNLTDEEAIAITDALESLADNPGNPEHVEAYRQLIRQIGIDQEGTFMYPGHAILEDPMADNFVHHSFDMTKDSPVEVAQWKEARKKDIKAAYSKADEQAHQEALAWGREQVKAGKVVTKEQVEAKKAEIFETLPKTTTYTLARAEASGLHPIRDIRHVLGNHIQDHFRKNAQFAFLKGIVGEFGVDLGEKGAQTASKLGLMKVPSKKFIGDAEIYVPREIGNTIRKLDSIFYGADDAGSELRDLYDQALGWLKVGQTVINPGHHIRNALSDITLNYLDGVVDPLVYQESYRISRALRQVDDEARTKLFADPQGNAIEDLGTALEDIKIKVGNTELTGRQVWDQFVNSGAKSGYYRTEIAVGKGGVIEKIRGMAEAREDWTRLAHFIDALKKEGETLTGGKGFLKGLDDAAKKAGQRVRKYNIDYGDLTPFEQRVMRRVIPFYTWMRKNIPLQIETLFMRPGRQMVVPKVVRNLQAMLGQSREDTDILGLNSLPDYMQHAMHVNLLGEGTGRNGVYWNPGSVFPVMDLNEFFGAGTPRDLAERQLSGLTPLAQIPIQQITGYNFFTGRPENKGILQSLMETTPAGRFGYGVSTGQGPTGTRLANILTGAGLTSLSEGMQRGELRRQEDIVQELLRRRREQLESGTA